MENATDQTRYQEGALACLKQAGCDTLRVFCLGCSNWHWLRMENAIGAVGPEASLVMIARRMRCRACGARGAHIEPADPPAIGTEGYRAWAVTRRRWLLAQLERLKDLDARLPPGQTGG